MAALRGCAADWKCSLVPINQYEVLISLMLQSSRLCSPAATFAFAAAWISVTIQRSTTVRRRRKMRMRMRRRGLPGGALAGQRQALRALGQAQQRRQLLRGFHCSTSRAVRQQAHPHQQQQQQQQPPQQPHRRHALASRSRFSSSRRSPLLSRSSRSRSLSSRSSRVLHRCRGPAAARGGSAVGSLLLCP